MKTMTIQIPGDRCPVPAYVYAAPRGLIVTDELSESLADIEIELRPNRSGSHTTVICFLSPNPKSLATERMQLGLEWTTTNPNHYALSYIIRTSLREFSKDLKVLPSYLDKERSFADMLAAVEQPVDVQVRQMIERGELH